MKSTYLNSTRRKRIAQVAAAGILASSLTLGVFWPTAEAAELPQDEPKAVGQLVIPGIPNVREPVILKPQIDNERKLQLKLDRWEASKDAAEPEPEEEPELYTERELELLACVIYCEAGSDTITDETRRMVGEVVLNRVAHPDYPDNILDVLTQKSQYGRFHWTGVVWPARAGKAAEAHAVERAYDCARLVFEDERLLPTDTIYQAAHIQGEIVARAPGFYFCR